MNYKYHFEQFEKKYYPQGLQKAINKTDKRVKTREELKSDKIK